MTSWHRGCNSEHSPPLRRARIAQQAHHLDIDPPETGMDRSPLAYDLSVFGLGGRTPQATRILARRKGVLGVVLRALYDYGASHTRIQCSEILFSFLTAARPCSLGMAGVPWPMRTRRRRCLVFATHTASDYLPRLTRAARRVQGPRSGPFRKLLARPRRVELSLGPAFSIYL